MESSVVQWLKMTVIVMAGILFFKLIFNQLLKIPGLSDVVNAV